MPYPGPLFERSVSAPPVPRGLPLVVALTGFTDAGGAISGTVDHLRDVLEPHPVVVFSNDVLLDYRARRPLISYDTDHLTDYRPQRLEVSLAHDALGQPFLALTGYEPDFAWEAFTEAMIELIDAYGVSSVTSVLSIPMPVPHTRPMGTTVSGNRAELTEAHSVWKPHTQVPTTAAHLLEYRLAAAGVPVASFALLVPHYLADTEYPAATLAALDSIAAATGLVFSGDELREENRDYVTKVDDQVAGNDELGRMLVGLEERYDSYMAGSGLGTPMIHTGDLPSADELAAELERFLATRPTDEDKRG